MKKKATIVFLAFLFGFCIAIPAANSQVTGKWTTTSSAGFQGRNSFVSCVVNGKIYLIGGNADATGALLSTVQVYDPSGDAWTTLTTTGTFTPRYNLAASVVDGKIYIFGGCNDPQESNAGMVTAVEVFDPATNVWTALTTTGTFTPRDNLCSCVVNGKIYVIGGFDGAVDLTAVEIFDPATTAWSTPTTTGSFEQRGVFAIAVIDGKIYTLGGYDNGVLTSKTQVLDPATNIWTTLSTTGTFTPRWAMGYGVINGKIFLAGGGSLSGGILNTFEVFDPSTNKWSKPAATGTFSARYYFSCSVVDGKLYAIGGGPNEVFTPASANVNTSDAAAMNIGLAPNPTVGSVTVYNAPAGAHVTIENILGKTVMEVRNTQTSAATLDLSNLPAGTYFAKIMTQNAVVTRKIVRE